MKTEESKPENPYINAMCDGSGFTQYGMTLRDHFAGLAMQSIIVSSNYDIFTGNNGMPVPNFVAEQGYILADAMLKQREI